MNGIAGSSIFTKTHFFDFIDGIGFGYLNNRNISEEQAIRQGRNPWMTAISQLGQISIARLQVSKLLEKWGKSIPYPLAKLNIFIVTSPLLLAYISKQDIKNKTLRKVVNIIQDHVGALCMIASTVSTIGLFILGSKVYATTTLAYLGIGILDRKGILPRKCRQIIHPVGFVLGTFSGLVNGDILTRIFCIVDLAGFAFNQYHAFKLRKMTPEQLEDAKIKKHDYIPPCPVTPADLEHKFLFLHDVKINKSHVNADLLPSTSVNTKISDILNVFDKIVPSKNELERLSKSTEQEDIDKLKNWEKHQCVLLKKLSKDARWKEVESLKKSSPEEFLREALVNILTQIEKQEILIGEPISYEMLTKYTLFIAEKLPHLTARDQIDILFRLGIEGGNYCGQGKLEVVEDIATKLLGFVEGLPLKTKFLAVLQQKRVQIWNQMYNVIWEMNPTLRLEALILDTNDVHTRNIMLNLSGAGELFGIPHEAAKQDKAAEIPPSLTYICVAFRKMIQEAFWNGAPLPKIFFKNNKNLANEDFWKVWKWYTPEMEIENIQPYTKQCILETISNAIGKEIPRHEIFAWWNDWIQRQETLNDQRKEELADELAIGNLFNQPLESNALRGTIKEKFLIAMLLEFGIFTKTK